MLIEDIRARLRDRLVFLGQGAKSNFIKERLASAGLSETYLDQMLVSRKPDSLPIDPTISKVEAIAKALDLSIVWLIHGIGRPEAMFAPKPEPQKTAQIVGLQPRINRVRGKNPQRSQAENPARKK